MAKGIGTAYLIGLEARQSSNFGTVSTESYSKVGSTMQAGSEVNMFVAYFNSVNGVVDVFIKLAKLEIGSYATDYSLNPEDIATNDSVQTAIKNALDKADYSTNAEINSKISTGVGQAKTYAEQTINKIIGAAPATLDTIAELADAVTENKDGVQAINNGITKKADKTDVTALQNTVKTMITSISQADYDALVSAGTVDPKILYVIPDA
ncbi:hypothetical protein [Companilactobacillus alimentarius]|uniref:hypothetical protein n=1 Tax=Companilactobacillus alimentarius TaxID=1602 RepID=UPI0028B649B8|nr:hypothetical protein [Companilactobacillus alimentarius]MDT6951157.1 hypothetical protein [Companilactobacillus alimentarius]MDT6953615.1 hypothetical protein [Companilactobacillus alimentarius]MDT6953695.1 hypothetical protein [Companilactobacillus alimentarius]